MARHSNKQALLDAGRRVMFRQGFNGATVRDIVAEAGVPQGSFTNHFASKEQFGGEVLDQYFANVRTLLAASLGDKTLTPRARLERYLDLIVGRLEADGFRRGCLIGDMSLELTQTSETIREQLRVLFEQWLQPFTECIAEGQASGEFRSDFPPDDLADFFLASWQGAILRMKVERDGAPLMRFRRIVFATIMKDGMEGDAIA